MNFRGNGVPANNAPLRVPFLNKAKVSDKTELKKKAAFTMAEVLITISIISIIASVTKPQLLGHYQKKVVATRLKRAYNIIARTIERSKVSYGGLS